LFWLLYRVFGLAFQADGLIILAPLLNVNECLIGLFDFGEACLIAAFVDVGVVDLGQLYEVCFDLFGGGGCGHLEHLIEGSGFWAGLREAVSEDSGAEEV
jgi:hypothetical protein